MKDLKDSIEKEIHSNRRWAIFCLAVLIAILVLNNQFFAAGLVGLVGLVDFWLIVDELAS